MAEALDRLDRAVSVVLVSNATSIAAAVLFIVVVDRLTDRQRAAMANADASAAAYR
jgi:hypothetical protein